MRSGKRTGTWILPALALLLASCAAAPVKFNVSPSVPSTEASLDVRKAENGNRRLALAVDHLPRPDRLTPPAATYVVWLRPRGEKTPAQNIGALNVDDDLRGTLDTITPHRAFDLFVTAEAAPNALEPTRQPLLWTTIAR